MNLETAISMTKAYQELSIDMVNNQSISQNNRSLHGIKGFVIPTK